MCMIIAKRQGDELLLPELEASMKTASIHNSNGCGIAVKKSGSDSIILTKGYFYHELVIDKIKELDIQPDDQLMIHMRHSTSGKVDIKNCHPYVVSSELDDILMDEIVLKDKSVVSHNGTFLDYVYKKSKYSDTVHYIQEFLCMPGVIDAAKTIKYANRNEMFSLFGNNRLCIMHPGKGVPMDFFGSWNELTKNTFLYSNYYHTFPNDGYRQSNYAKYYY